MDRQNTDRRVKKTKAVLRKTLIRLMAEKKLGEITVTEICELADVNRGTFYLHYSDVYNFLDVVQDEICNDLVASIYTSAKGKVGDPTTLYDIFYNILVFIVENEEDCKAILSPDWSEGFFDKILEIPKQSCLESWTQIYGNSDIQELDTLYYYVVSGCIGLIKRWFSMGQKESPERMASNMGRYITSGVSALGPARASCQ